jgi:RHS repeat-associated protein
VCNLLNNPSNQPDEIRNLEYEYDLMNNVTQRQNHISGLSEGFTYDALDRLTQSSTTGKIDDVDYSYAVSYQYDINGNITNKSDVGDYSYNAVNGVNSTHPHTPNSIAGLKTHTNNQDRTYTYDANGSMTKNGNKSITWTSFNKPKQFTKGTDSTTFTYGPDRSRYQKVQTRSSDNTTITTQYFGKVYEKIKQNTSTEHKYFIYLDKQLIAIHIKTDTTSTADTADTTNTPATPIPDKTRYLHYDNLGSIDTITDGQGNIVERMSYAAFGERRKGDWRASDPLLPIIPTLTNRGFTGHEHIDEMGLIHMNGRVYDPQIGRFLSADPYIQSPYNTQSYNRYSYTINNPLKYTDPTGNFFGVILGIISAVSTNAVIAAIGTKLFLAKIIIAYAVTYSVTYIATGSGKAAQGAGLSAALFMGIGELRGGKMGANGKMQYNPGWESGSMKTLAAHGLAGGIVQDRMGGSFGAGFLSGSLGSYLGSSGHSKNMFEMIGNTAREAVVGGTISVIGGGKFANGAQTGAFRYLFNDSFDHLISKGSHDYERTSSVVCSTSSQGCSIKNVALQVQKVGAFPNQKSAVLNNGTAQLFDVALLPLNSDDIFSIPTSTGVVNVTLPNHVLYPGVVTRDAVLINNSIYIRTQGSGRGYWGGINNFLKDNVWSPIDQKVINKFR